MRKNTSGNLQKILGTKGCSRKTNKSQTEANVKVWSLNLETEKKNSGGAGLPSMSASTSEPKTDAKLTGSSVLSSKRLRS